MTQYQAGQDIVLEFDGEDHNAVVIDHRGAYVMATMEVDATLDYGSASARMSPHQTVCVPVGRVRLPDDNTTVT